MRNIAALVIFALLVTIFGGFGKMAQAETYVETNTQTKTDTKKKPEVQPDPMRSVCAYMWDRYYEKEKTVIRVSTRGRYDETVVFTCPICNTMEHFINPFLNTEYQGKTGMDRIKECGFTRVIFKGGRGIEEIVRQVM
jgi:hypothetical protein